MTAAWMIVLFGVLLFASLSRGGADSVDSGFEDVDLPNDPKKVKALEAEEAALYQKKKALIDKALREIKKIAKEIRPHLNATDLGIDAQGEDAQFLHSEALMVGRSKRQASVRNYPNNIWAEGVNYFFDPAFSQNGRNKVRQAIAFYEATTCIRFHEVAADSAAADDHKVRIYAGPGCGSAVGKQTDPVQELSLGRGCESMSTASHELGHALGFLHAQSRHDRNDWIWVDLDNVAEDNKGQYNHISNYSNNNFGLRYDYRSIMHYTPKSFGIDRSKDVMIAYNSKYQMAMGASQVPVFSDIAQLNQLYSCNACAGGTINCARGGYPHPNDCTRCHCPSGFGGNDCTQRAPPSPGLNCGQTLTATGEWQTLKQNNVCGNGQQTTADMTNPSLCTYHIQAPPGHRIEYWVNFIGFDGRSDALCHAQCRYGGLNLKGHDLDLRPEGYRLCCPSQLAERLLTAGDLLVVEAFNNFRYTDFQITYRIDPCGATLTATTHFQWYTSNYAVGNGKHETADRNNPTTCTWTIEAPAGSKLLYAVNFVGFDGNRSALCYWDCWYGAVEVQGDQRLKYCCPQQESQLVRNDGNRLTVKVTNIFRYTEFKIQYAIDPCAKVPTVCYNGGVLDPNSCGRCECLPGFAGTDCSVRAPPSGGATCGQIILASTSWQWFAQNNVVGHGSWTPLDRNNPAKCTYIIEAPKGKRIEYEMNFVGFDGNENGLCTPDCANGGVVVRGHGAFWQPEGINFCCHNDYNQRRTSGTNLLVLQAWNSLRYTDFQIAYRVV